LYNYNIVICQFNTNPPVCIHSAADITSMHVTCHNYFISLSIPSHALTIYIYKYLSTKRERVPLVLTYSNHLPNIQQIVNKHMHILHKSDKLKKVFKQPPITAYKRDTNLQDILIHNKHNKIFNNNTEKCQKCAICRYITEENTYTINNREYKFNNKMNCKTSNVVYAINCKECRKVNYIGETGTTTYERFSNHLSVINRKQDNPISNHFNENNHTINDVEFVCIEKINRNDTHLRRIRESFWITKLNTVTPNGLNMNNGFNNWKINNICKRNVGMKWFNNAIGQLYEINWVDWMI